MWDHAGVVRSGDALASAADEIERLTDKVDPAPSELRNMLTVSGLIVEAALRRKESRGGHFRSDYPEPDPFQANRNLVEPIPEDTE